MTRNVLKQAEIGRKAIDSKRTLSVYELKQMITIFNEKTEETKNIKEGLYEALIVAFHMGYAVGLRANKA